ncbi:murein biosynthesis integral membrane protein MurJ [Leucobacter sp. W1478]|uniref:murein biosynthesis integral membrane protein MurJ n=1 Tax=Leucobacter sp. W1478 TaxID=3439065 RepID=UPI003F2A4CE2
MASGLLRASAVMAAGTVLSRLLGFAKAVLLVAAIGQTSISADAFANGNMLPNTVYVILMGGMLNAVLVPQIVKAATASDGGLGYINKVMTFVIITLSAITTLAMLSAPVLVWLFQLSWSTEQLTLSLAFAYWCIPQIIFYGIYTVMGEVLNARSVFGPYTWAPVLNNLISIAGILAFMAMFGADPDGLRGVADWNALSIAVLGGSATLGVVAQALILFVSWRKAGITYRPDFVWRGIGLGQTAKIAGWSLATIVITTLAGIVTGNVVGTATGEGPSTIALQNAWLILMLPHSVLAVTLATAYFTRLSESWRDGRVADFRSDFSSSLRQISLVMVLASVLIFTGAPFLSRLMQLSASAELIDPFALVLQVYVFALAPFSFLFVVQRSFYALSDTRTPFFFTIVQVLVLVALSVAGLAVVGPERIGAWVAGAYAVSTVFQVLLAIWLLRRRIGSVDGRRILRSLGSFALAAIPALAVGLFITHVSRQMAPALAVGEALVASLVLVVVCSALYLMALAALRSPELREVAGVLRRRFGRKS